jgi:hypothetical protein
LFFSLVALAVVSYCSRPDVRKKDLATSRAPSALLEQLQAPARSIDSAVPSSTRFVKAIQLNVRSSPNGTVIDTLARGTPIIAYAEVGKWVRISRDDEAQRWVSGPNLCAEPGCADAAPVPVRPASSGLAKPYVPVEQRRSRSSTSLGYGCPCSGSANCIGPRGGRYCITSGGNKRYR